MTKSNSDTTAKVDTAQPGWKMRPYQPGDEVELAALFNLVFDRDGTPEWWLWKIKGRSGPAENAFVAVDAEDGHVVAQYVALPIRVRLLGQIRDVMVTVDTMTAPEYRRRGILNKLAAEAYETWRAAGVSAVFGLPNEQAKTQSNDRGWNALFPLPWLRLRLPAQQLRNRLRASPRAVFRSLASVTAIPATVQRWVTLRRLRALRGSDKFHVEEVKVAGTDFDLLFEQTASHYDNLVVRDSAWVNWRFIEARKVGLAYIVILAKKDGEPMGYAAYRMNTSTPVPTGLLADLFVAPDALDVAASLVHRAAVDLFDEGAGSIMFASSVGSIPASLLTRLGLRPLGAGFHFEMVPLAPDVDLKELASPSNWLLTGADFDIV